MTATIRSMMFCLAMLAAATAPAGDVSPSAEKAARALQIIKSDAAAKDKAVPCKQLAVYGGKEAVPALAALLPNPELSSWARIALEAIPDPAADEALRDALGKLRGRLLIGVVNSIGVRGDAKAVDALAGLVQRSDADAASAAACALGHIPSAAAAKALETHLASGPAAVRSAVAEGCILHAERCAAEAKTAEAVRLYELVRKADVPKQRMLEATRGLILARKSAGVPLLVEQLRSADKGSFQLALTVARELPGKEVGAALVAELARAPAERQPLLLFALADRGDAAGLPAMLAAAKSGPENLRVAAIRALERINAVAAAPVLLDAAVADGPAAAAAADALAAMQDKEIDQQIVARAAEAAGRARQVLLQLAGQRRIAAAAPLALKAAEDSDAGVRAAALAALGQTIEFRDLPTLIGWAVNPQRPEDAAASAAAVKAAATRMPDREATADLLAAAMTKAPTAGKTMILEILTAMGGGKALQTVAAAAKDSNAAVEDVGSRLLGYWMSPDAAPLLLDLAKNAKDGKHRIRALRGYIRIGRQLDVSPRQRIEMVGAALKVAQRDDEKKLAVGMLRRSPTLDSLGAAVLLLADPAVKAEAGVVAVFIGEKLVRGEPAAVGAAMKQVIAAKLPGDASVRAKALVDMARSLEKKPLE